MLSKIKTWIAAKLSAVWAWLKGSCLHSLTVFWAYLQVLAGALLAYSDVVVNALAQTLNDPAFDQLKSALPPKWLGVVVAVLGVVTFMARLRSIAKRA